MMHCEMSITESNSNYQWKPELRSDWIRAGLRRRSRMRRKHLTRED